MDTHLAKLMARYLKAEEGLTDLTEREINNNIIEGVGVFGSEAELTQALEDYLSINC